MARPKRSSTILEAARQRLSGLKSITPKPDFGPALSLEGYEQEINAYGAKLDKYNEALSTLDGLQNDLDAAETGLNDKNKRMLSAVGALYGTDSDEYEVAEKARGLRPRRPCLLGPLLFGRRLSLFAHRSPPPRPLGRAVKERPPARSARGRRLCGWCGWFDVGARDGVVVVGSSPRQRAGYCLRDFIWVTSACACSAVTPFAS
jgi:hypothetical protein